MQQEIFELLAGAQQHLISNPNGLDKTIKCYCFDTVSSTNYAARLYAEAMGNRAELPLLLVADSQSNGRGRMDRSFYSPADTGLYMTLLLKPKTREEFVLLTALSAVAAADAIKSRFSQSVQIKWVNDLYKDGKKVAGILAESYELDGERFVAVGIGINLSTKDFPEGLSDKAGALFFEREVAKEERLLLAKKISQNLLKSLSSKSKEKYMKKYRKASLVIGKEIEFLCDGKLQSGKALDIDAEGALLVRLPDGQEKRLSTGEISVFLK